MPHSPSPQKTSAILGTDTTGRGARRYLHLACQSQCYTHRVRAPDTRTQLRLLEEASQPDSGSQALRLEQMQQHLHRCHTERGSLFDVERSTDLNSSCGQAVRACLWEVGVVGLPWQFTPEKPEQAAPLGISRCFSKSQRPGVSLWILQIGNG